MSLSALNNMIDRQIRPWNVVNDDVLNVMKQIPRDEFVPKAYKDLAFSDCEIKIAHGETMLYPKIEAHLLQALQIRPGDKVLEIGTGRGYLTACLSQLSNCSVTSVDIHLDLVEGSANRLKGFGFETNNLRVGDAFSLDFEPASFDVVAVTGRLPTPTPVFEKLLNLGGRLFQVVGGSQCADAQFVTSTPNGIERVVLFETSLASLHNAPQETEFTF